MITTTWAIIQSSKSDPQAFLHSVIDIMLSALMILQIHNYFIPRKFAGKVQELSMKEKTLSKKRSQLYDKPGRHTFFVPVDAAFEVMWCFLLYKGFSNHILDIKYTSTVTDSIDHTYIEFFAISGG